MVEKIIESVCIEFNVSREKLLEKKHKGINRTQPNNRLLEFNPLPRQIVCWIYSCKCEYNHGRIKTLKSLREALSMDKAEIAYAIHHIDELVSIDKILRLKLKSLLNGI